MNVNTIQAGYGVQRTSRAAANSDVVGDVRSTAHNREEESVRLSAQAKSLSELPPLMLPTRENVQKLSAALSEDLKRMLDQAGIDTDPPVEFAVDSYTGKVSVKGDRPDAQKIDELVKNNPGVELQIHNVAALSSHVVAMGPALEADAAYRAAQSSAEIDKVIARYASVYGGQTKATDFSLVFNGTDVQVNANGAEWLSTAGSSAS